MPSSGTYHTVL